MEIWRRRKKKRHVLGSRIQVGNDKGKSERPARRTQTASLLYFPRHGDLTWAYDFNLFRIKCHFKNLSNIKVFCPRKICKYILLCIIAWGSKTTYSPSSRPIEVQRPQHEDPLPLWKRTSKTQRQGILQPKAGTEATPFFMQSHEDTCQSSDLDNTSQSLVPQSLFLLTCCLTCYFLQQWILLATSPASFLHAGILTSALSFVIHFPSAGPGPTSPSTKGGSWLIQTNQDTISFDFSPLVQEWTCNLNHSPSGNWGHLIRQKLGQKHSLPLDTKAEVKAPQLLSAINLNQPALEQRQHCGQQCGEKRKFLSVMLSHLIHQPEGCSDLGLPLLRSINCLSYFEFCFLFCEHKIPNQYILAWEPGLDTTFFPSFTVKPARRDACSSLS